MQGERLLAHAHGVATDSATATLKQGQCEPNQPQYQKRWLPAPVIVQAG